MGDEYVYYLLDKAIELLPPTKLLKLARCHFTDAQIAERLAPDVDRNEDLVAEVKQFEKESLAGKYYDSFDVNSKNYMDVSMGTRAWFSDFRRLFQRCVANAKVVEPMRLRDAFDTLFGLLDHIDECHDDVIFFADEGGSWQVGLDWREVLPAYFKCLSACAEPQEYAARVVAVVDKHERFSRDKYLAVARRCGTAEQRKSLRGA